MPKFHLVFLIHGHQPIGNFDDVFERVYQVSYLPFLETLARHPAIHMGLHYSGPLLEWIEARHPEFFERLRQLIQRRQVELVGGGFYEPILVSIPSWDQEEQLRRMREYLGEKLGRAPTGAWLTERVWEPQLPSVLAPAGVQYTLVDDLHFVASGFELDQLNGDYLVEDAGHTVRVLPGLKILRYLLPFRPVQEAIDFLRQSAARHPGGMAATGDDNEKFGAWPGTYDLCYGQGWLHDFFTALENSSEWLETLLPSDYLAAHAPLGRADLPTASYEEMMEWALPTPVHKVLDGLTKEFAQRPDVIRFLRGAPWRAFFTKYSESNLLHKKMLRASGGVRRAAGQRPGGVAGVKMAAAHTHVLRAQCNDAYWHGIFGGLYAPHLRTALWTELVRAESLLQEVSRADALRIERGDYDADGRDEILVAAQRFAGLLRPSDGGTLAMLDFPLRSTTLVNSLQRRPEAYHDRIRQSTVGAAAAAVTIHEIVRSKEAGLDKFLRYDRWPRNAFRLLLFRPEKKFEDYQDLKLNEEESLAGGLYSVRAADEQGVILARDVPWPFGNAADSGVASPELLLCTKKFNFAQSKSACQVSCEIELATAKASPARVQVGLEIVLNFLAPDAPTRYFETATGRHPLNWAAAVPAAGLPAGLRVLDEWQGVAVTLRASAAGQFWIAPIETISESEDGFERVYQGSQILAVWSVDLASSAGWRGKFTLDVEAIDALAPQPAGA